MEKSEDNFYNFYYLRALVLANLQNYKQAISDVSTALSIQEDANGYLLRAKCLQIDGNPGEAFADLQSFIGKQYFNIS
jgi:tetratricopeptide (TPR) repeat protein